MEAWSELPPAGQFMLDEVFYWLISVSEDHILISGQIRFLRLYGAQSVVTGYHQNHASGVEGIPCRENQRLSFRRLHLTTNFESGPRNPGFESERLLA
jgi:hypothetical protein